MSNHCCNMAEGIAHIFCLIITMPPPPHDLILSISRYMEQLMVKTGLPAQEAKIELHRQMHPESIKYFTEDQASCRMIWLLPHPHPPLPSAYCLTFLVFLCVACRAYSQERGGGGSSQIIRRLLINNTLLLHLHQPILK
jgi:hypothetical protein